VGEGDDVTSLQLPVEYPRWNIGKVILFMDRKKLRALLLVLLLSLSACRSQQQQRLAEELGVDTQKYPITYGFPATYYHSILTEDMTIKEVHNLIRGYTKVFRCGDHQETYYYFSDGDRTALRFEVWYDEGKFNGIVGEDSDSRTIRIEDCEPGRLPEKPAQP
jgi:hypothetical protein